MIQRRSLWAKTDSHRRTRHLHTAPVIITTGVAVMEDRVTEVTRDRVAAVVAKEDGVAGADGVVVAEVGNLVTQASTTQWLVA